MFGLSYKDVMAFTSLPKLVPIGSPRVSAEEITRNMLTEVLQSEPVKKLLAKPNILIKAVSFTPNEKLSPNGQSRPSVIKTTTNHAKKRSHAAAMKNEDAHLLPSKKSGKSEIILMPLRRQLKSCGHYESCEKIVCDVQIQQYVDYEGSSPLLARTINESEITAPVSKHCSDPRCDALSIDHNFCRRASVRLCRIDKSNACDVCGTILKTRKSRLHHQNCRRPEHYSHDDVDVDLVRRRRMREREIQLTEALKLRRNDYSDPILGPKKAIEVLKKNSELIVIPKAPTPPPPPLVVQPTTIAPQPAPIITLQAAHPSAVPIVLPPQPIVRPKILLNPVRVAPATKVIQPPSVVAIEPASKAAPANKKFIVSTVPQGTSSGSGVVSYPVMLSDWVSSQPVEYVQPEPVLMPVRVVPIASLKSEPSLLHQKQGVPKFCIIADNSVPPQSFVNLPAFSTIQPLSNVTGIHTIQTVTPAAAQSEPRESVEPKAAEKPADNPSPPAPAEIKKAPVKKKKGKTSEKRTLSSKRNTKRANAEPGETDANFINVTVPSRKKKYIKKPYQCKYCAKKFLTDWYYRMHVARHKIKSKLICDVCNKTFSNNYDLKNHMADKHTEKFEFIMDEKDLEQVTLYVACDNCENVFDSVAEMEAHNCKGVMMTDDSKESSSDIIVPPFYGNGECNSEEIEKENGVCGRMIVEPSKKLKNDEQSVIINNKYSSRRKTRHSARDECHELSSNSVIKINPHNIKCQDYEGELVIDEDRLDDSF